MSYSFSFEKLIYIYDMLCFMCVFECMQFVSIFPGLSYFNAHAQIPNVTHFYPTLV